MNEDPCSNHEVLMMLHRQATWTGMIILQMFFVCKIYLQLLRCVDVQKFDTDTILYGEIHCKKNDILLF